MATRARRERSLRPEEIALAVSVFGQTLPPWDLITITNVTACGDPFAVPRMFKPGWLVNLGLPGFEDATATGTWWDRGNAVVYPDGSMANVVDVFIHELTHVWQSWNSRFQWGYVANSVWHHATFSSKYYKYRPLKAWEKYNVEQQACLVEQWFHDTWVVGSPSLTHEVQEADDRFPYIRDNIRKGTYAPAPAQSPIDRFLGDPSREG
jgi:hypothetical protein